jgi:hypothetical protein
MGIETVLDTVGFDELLRNADMAISGEGRIDSQSMSGKVVIGVARRAKKQNVPVVVLTGDIGEDIEAVYDAVGEHIRNGDMEYYNLTEQKGFERYNEDRETSGINLDVLHYGYMQGEKNLVKQSA